jgi:hypothetical protein
MTLVDRIYLEYYCTATGAGELKKLSSGSDEMRPQGKHIEGIYLL